MIRRGEASSLEPISRSNNTVPNSVLRPMNEKNIEPLPVKGLTDEKNMPQTQALERKGLEKELFGPRQQSTIGATDKQPSSISRQPQEQLPKPQLQQDINPEANRQLAKPEPERQAAKTDQEPRVNKPELDRPLNFSRPAIRHYSGEGSGQNQSPPNSFNAGKSENSGYNPNKPYIRDRDIADKPSVHDALANQVDTLQNSKEFVRKPSPQPLRTSDSWNQGQKSVTLSQGLSKQVNPLKPFSQVADLQPLDKPVDKSSLENLNQSPKLKTTNNYMNNSLQQPIPENGKLDKPNQLQDTKSNAQPQIQQQLPSQNIQPQQLQYLNQQALPQQTGIPTQLNPVIQNTQPPQLSQPQNVNNQPQQLPVSQQVPTQQMVQSQPITTQQNSPYQQPMQMMNSQTAQPQKVMQPQTNPQMVYPQQTSVYQQPQPNTQPMMNSQPKQPIQQQAISSNPQQMNQSQAYPQQQQPLRSDPNQMQQSQKPIQQPLNQQQQQNMRPQQQQPNPYQPQVNPYEEQKQGNNPQPQRPIQVPQNRNINPRMQEKTPSIGSTIGGEEDYYVLEPSDLGTQPVAMDSGQMTHSIHKISMKNRR